jgi:hypothetical protein
MGDYEFKTTTLIAETLEECDIKFGVKKSKEAEQILVGFPIECGPDVFMRYICNEDDNTVGARIFNLVPNIPKEKRLRAIEACNEINRKMRYINFCLDDDDTITAKYDFPQYTPDDGIGNMALEIFVRATQILDSEYGIFMRALYTDDELVIHEE